MDAVRSWPDMAGLTRRRFVRDAAGAGLALTLPGVLAEWPRTGADAAGPAATAGFRDADYWAFADRVAPMLDRYWSAARRHYAVPGGGDTALIIPPIDCGAICGGC